MANFYTLNIKEVKKETADCVSLSFEVPSNLKSQFEFKQGQYLTFKINYGGEELRRSYSICSSPLEDKLAVAVKRIPQGKISNYLFDKGETLGSLEVMPPMGSFYTELNENNEKHYVAFAAGSGITPIISILKTTLKREPKSKFTLFYGNKSPETIVFKSELESLAAAYTDHFKLVYIYSAFDCGDEMLCGRMDADKAAKLIDNYVTDGLSREFFMCGPEQMTLGIADMLKKSYDTSSVHIELFTTPVAKPKEKSISTVAGGMSAVTVIIDGDETELTVDQNGDSILDAALDAGLDVPFACKGAVCCTCKGKVLEGEVEMDMNYALSDAEVAEGFVLTCQAHPRSERVIVDFDEI
jgi:ring-1,2-phenylacetyl-CoA epoxidase subunit PaaE